LFYTDPLGIVTDPIVTGIFSGGFGTLSNRLFIVNECSSQIIHVPITPNVDYFDDGKTGTTYERKILFFIKEKSGGNDCNVPRSLRVRRELTSGFSVLTSTSGTDSPKGDKRRSSTDHL